MTVPNVQPTARPTLISLTEAHMTQLIREAVQVQRHCKRARIHLPNEDATLVKLPGDTNKDRDRPGVLKRRLHAEDINMALQWRGSEKIYATGVVGHKHVSSDRINDNQKKVQLKDYLKSEMDWRPPQEVGLTLHWLAVDGVQPDIPQNPSPAEQMAVAAYSNSVAANKRKAAAAAAAATVVHRVEDDDDDEDGTDGSGGTYGVQVTQLLPRLLSEELQLYFSRITSAIERGGATPVTRQQQDAALQSLSKDPGLQELVPFMVNYVTKNLFKNMGTPEHCRILIRMANALLDNTHIHLELYLHQLLPAILTMVVAERLSSRPWDNHWVLRDAAASCLVKACNLFGEDYATLKARVLRKLCEALSPDRSLTTQYGGIVGITFFGPKAINAFLLPLVQDYWQQWQEALAHELTDLERRMDVQMCQQATLNALGVFLGPSNKEAPEAMDIEWEELEETFGDQLVLLSTNETEYALCFI